MLQSDLVRGPEHEREAWRPHRRVPAAVRDGVRRRVRRQMESQVVAVRSSADQPVLDDPVLAGDEQDAALVNRVVAWADRFTPRQVERVGLESPEKRRARKRSLWPARPVRHLIEAVHRDGAARDRPLEPLADRIVGYVDVAVLAIGDAQHSLR